MSGRKARGVESGEGLTDVTMSVDVRGLLMSLTLPFRLECVLEEPAQFLDVEVLGLGPRIEPTTERLPGALESVAFKLEAKEAVERVRDGEV